MFHKLRVNRGIRAKEVRLVDEEGRQIGVMDTDSALKEAKERGLDLIEVDPRGKPPVCKIADYGKYTYRQKKKFHERHKKHTHLKEIRLRPKTARHDADVKIKHARKFLEHSSKVLVVMQFKGRELEHTEIGKDLLEYFAKQLEDIAKIEKTSQLKHERMTMLLIKK